MVGKCGVKKKNGEPCSAAAGSGTNHVGYGACKYHGGNTLNANRNATLEKVKDQVEALGLEYEIDPGQALLNLVWQVAGDLEYYKGKVNELQEQYQIELGANGSSKLSVHPYTELYHQAQNRLAQISKLALQAGIEERRVRIAERDASIIYQAIHVALQSLGVGVEDIAKFRSIFNQQISLSNSVQNREIENR